MIRMGLFCDSLPAPRICNDIFKAAGRGGGQVLAVGLPGQLAMQVEEGGGVTRR